MIINAKPTDSLNVLFNTPTAKDEELSVVLPQGAVYHEKVVVNRDNLVVTGNSSTIEFDDYNSKYPSMGTASSAVLTVNSSNVIFRDLTVVNSFDFSTPHQAVAVFIAPLADKVVFDSCTLKGHQDTLFADGERNLFLDCTIEGCIDFIFGRATADFNGCKIVSNGPGFVCAPSTSASTEMGFTFMDCSFESTELVEPASVFLARPWHPSGKPGVSPFMFVSNCKLGSHINPSLWTAMTDSKGIVHKPEDSRFVIAVN